MDEEKECIYETSDWLNPYNDIFDFDKMINDDAEVMRMVDYLEEVEFAEEGEISDAMLSDGDCVVILFQEAIREGFKPNQKYLLADNEVD